MVTRYLAVDAAHPEPQVIAAAAACIKAGELVAFPTETVYGLGADAFRPEAVAKIFEAKGRPPENPLLVHICAIEQVRQLASEIAPGAQRLMEYFWPGPLSLILPARPEVPTIVTGGRPGVGIRMPAHPVALALIAAAGPLAAPSANRYGRPSPTNAVHVRQDLDGRIALVLDAGVTGSGLESTLVDFSTTSARILRRGGVTQEELETCLGETLPGPIPSGDQVYQTQVRVVLCADQADLISQLGVCTARGTRVGLLVQNLPENPELVGVERIFHLQSVRRGNNLYAIMREAEDLGIEILLVAPLDPRGTDDALRDRLARAAERPGQGPEQVVDPGRN